MTKYGVEKIMKQYRQARRMDELLRLLSRCWEDTQRKILKFGLTGHDAVLCAQKFGDFADFDGSVDVLHNIICERIG